MPLSNVPGVNEDAQKIIDAFHKLFGDHPGYRPGKLLSFEHLSFFEKGDR